MVGSCPKCRGLLVNHSLWEHHRFVNALRCVNCGKIIEQEMLNNRRNPPKIRYGPKTGRRIWEEPDCP